MLGNLDASSAKLLDRFGRNQDAEVPPVPEPPTRPGTLLVREWEGRLQRVMVLDQGFAWNGTTYDSLSKVAKAITGTNWNGPRFFGLRERTRVSS